MEKKTPKTLEEAQSLKLEQYKEQINTWKAKHGSVKAFFIQGDKPEDLKAVFFRQPLREELSAAERISTDKEGNIDMYKKADRHITDCFLGGDINEGAIFEETSIYMPVAKFVLTALVIEKKTSWVSC